MKLKRLCLLTIFLVVTLQLPIFGVYGDEQEFDKEFAEDKRALLNYYVSELTQHGFYLITLTVGFVGEADFSNTNWIFEASW